MQSRVESAVEVGVEAPEGPPGASYSEGRDASVLQARDLPPLVSATAHARIERVYTYGASIAALAGVLLRQQAIERDGILLSRV